MRRGTIFLLAFTCASAQPVIESVLNAANKRVSPVNPQILVSIRGQNLASAPQNASGYPLPYQLGGTSMTVNGIAAPLLYVSPDQINAQVPSGVKRGAQVQVVVRTGAGDSAPFTVTTAVDGAPGIFTRDVSGCGQGVVFNVHANGATDQNSPANSFDPLHDWGVMILGTGLYSSPTRKDGEAWQFDGQLGLGAAVQAFLGIEDLQHPSAVQATYGGPMPGTAGVDQINVPLSKDPTHIPRGCRVPLWFRTIQVNASQYVNISVADGGGSCSDPTPDALASVTIQTTHTSGISGSTAAGSIDAQFIRGPSLELPSGAPYGEQWGTVSEPPSYCAASFPETLGAGTLSVSSDSFGTLSLEPRTEEGVISYHAELPPGASLQGRLTITASGGSVDAFTAGEEIPPPIQILTQFPPGMSVAPDCCDSDEIQPTEQNLDQAETNRSDADVEKLL